MNKKTLTIDARMIDDSGIGTYLKNLLPYFLSQFKVTLLGDKERLSHYVFYNNCQVIKFNAKIYSIKEQLLFPLKIPRSDFFWSPHFNTPILPIKANKRITTIHDVNHLTKMNKMSYLKKLYSKILYVNAVKKSKKIITVSNFSKNEIIKYTNAKSNKITVIYCGVNKGFNIFSTKNIGLPEKYILFVGNVKPHKNLKTLLEAYGNLDNELQNKYKLVIMGKKSGFITPDSSVFEFIEKQSLSKFVFFTDYIDDELVSVIYKNAQILVFPSLYEGFGLPLIEAMTVGTAVLSSNAASLPEIGGEAVLYFNPKNSVELKTKIELLLLRPALQEEYIDKGFKRVKDFSWKNSAEKHISLIKEA